MQGSIQGGGELPPQKKIPTAIQITMEYALLECQNVP